MLRKNGRWNEIFCTWINGYLLRGIVSTFSDRFKGKVNTQRLKRIDKRSIVI